jgi:hypothetical protein|tara:strand:- start:3338 stop:3535 length:198 start_codon:yes stop_codon:yes gene_type:complete
MANMNHSKRNNEDKLKRQRGERVFKVKKATSKQKELLKKLGISFQPNINRKTASTKISEVLNKNV